MHHNHLNTRWEGPNLLVLEHDTEIDRIAATEIERVILVCAHGDRPSDLVFAIFQTPSHHVVLPASSGIAGRVHFERQGYWMQRACVYWASAATAKLPSRLMPGVWLLRRHQPGYHRLPIGELQSLVEQWPLDGPHTWEQRKWAHIAASRLLAPLTQAASAASARR
jgi:hypothetical protein